MDSVVLELKNVSKNINNKNIINNVSFQIGKGEVLGFLGPNGAGKTTIIRMIMGLIKVDSGTIKIKGYDVQNEYTNAMQYIGAIVGSPSLYTYLSGYENLLQRARLTKKLVSRQEINEIVELIGLSKKINEKVKTYSLGMKQRLAIGMALIGNPELLILDEPINGMDPEGVIAIRNLIRRLSRENNITVLISSHLLGELEHVCDKVLIINNGKKLMYTSIENIRKKSNLPEAIIEIPNEQSEKLRGLLKNKEWSFKLIENKLILQTDELRVQEILKYLIENKIMIESYQMTKKNLEEIYIDVINKDGDI
ncbi:ABC transporter ATP-binding protein [Massilibacterium senegalense]|uniref:ABC transporter ATP-binding protein n=1 Tax=Massilibacterium senegalense TaxID=1632858 RepID=UPI000781DDED|nr:ABC transporter ATP-binding protein [Massilibacterium senegalense]